MKQRASQRLSFMFTLMFGCTLLPPVSWAQQDQPKGSQEARDLFNIGVVAMVTKDHAQAKQAFEATLAHEQCPADLRISARGRLARILLAERTNEQQQQRQHRTLAQPPAQPDPADAVDLSASRPHAHNIDPIDGLAIAREYVEKGMQAIERREFWKAQNFFNMAFAYAPEAEAEYLQVEARGAIDLGGLAVGSVEHVHVVQQPASVSMNINFGVGRMLGMNTFQFTGGPAGDGFVQLPSISRAQVKTSVTAPAGVISRTQTFSFVRDYLILTKPKL